MKRLDLFSRFENGVYRLLAYFIIWGAPLLTIFLVDMFLLRELSPFIRYPLWAVLFLIGAVIGLAVAGSVEDFFKNIRKTFRMKPLELHEAEAIMQEIQELEKERQALIDDAAKRGVTIPTDHVLKYAEELRQKYVDSGQEVAAREVERVIRDFREQNGPEISVHKAYALMKESEGKHGP